MINWHLTYRDADVSTYSDGHGAYISIMHDKKTPPNAVEKIGGGSMEIPHSSIALLCNNTAQSQQKNYP